VSIARSPGLSRRVGSVMNTEKIAELGFLRRREFALRVSESESFSALSKEDKSLVLAAEREMRSLGRERNR